jgi:hypothetical protein
LNETQAEQVKAKPMVPLVLLSQHQPVPESKLKLTASAVPS